MVAKEEGSGYWEAGWERRKARGINWEAGWYPLSSDAGACVPAAVGGTERIKSSTKVAALSAVVGEEMTTQIGAPCNSVWGAAMMTLVGIREGHLDARQGINCGWGG